MKYLLASKASYRLSNVNLVTGAVITLFSTFLLAYAVPFQIEPGFASTTTISPRTLPYGVAALMLICGLKILHDGYLEKKRAAIRAQRGKQEELISFYTLSTVIVLIGFIFSGLMNTIGYPITNFILMVTLYYFSGGTKWKSALLLGVLFTIAAWLFFASYLKLSIPLGFGF